MTRIGCLVIAALCGCGGGDSTTGCPVVDENPPSAACASCTPTMLAPTDVLAYGLVVTPDSLAWLQSESVVSVPLAGGSPTELAQARATSGQVPHLRAFGSMLAWNSGADLHVYTAADGDRFVATSTASFSQASFTLDGTYIYTAEGAAGGAQLAAITFDGTTQRLWPLEALDVIADEAGPIVANCSGVFRAPRDGIDPVALVSRVCAVAVVETAAYLFINGYIETCASYGIVRIDRATGVIQPLLLLRDNRYRLFAADDRFVYFATDDGLQRISVHGGEPAMIFPGKVGAFALDATNLYVIAGGSLLRIAKD